jgi:hypothetical protein
MIKMPTPIIAITAQQDAKGGAATIAYTATVKPREGVYGIKPADPWYIDTNYSIAYQQNSFLLKSLTVEMTDNRSTYIQEAGAIVAAAIPFVVAAVPGPAPTGETDLQKLLPYNVDVADCFKGNLDAPDAKEKVSCSSKIEDKNGQPSAWTVTIVTDRNNSTSTFSYDDIFSASGRLSKNFPVPDCKEGFVSLEYNGTRNYISAITFANPTRLTSVPIPAKGSITYHPACSADTAYNASGAAKPLDLLKTTIDQVATAIKDYEAAKK